MLKTEEEIISITNIDDYISSLTNDDIVKKLFAFNELCQHKLTHIRSLFMEIANKENTINKLTSSSSTYQSINDVTTTNMTTKQEEHELRKEHQRNVYELEKEYHCKLENELNSLDECYRNEITHIINDHDIKVKQLHSEIHKLQSELEEMNNVKCIKRVEHEVKMKKMFDEHIGVIKKYDKQIEQSERNSMKKHKKKVNHNVDGIELELPKVDDYEHMKNDNDDNEEKVKMKENMFVMQLNKVKDVNKKNGKIIVLSQLNDKLSKCKVNTETSEGNECELEEDDDVEYKKNPIRNETYQIHLVNISSLTNL